MRAPMAFLLACLASTPALAHQMPKSAVLLDVRSREVQAELQLPIDRLQVALHHDGSGVPAPDAAAMLDAQRGRVEAYVLSHIHASGRGDVPWTISLQGMNEQVLEGDPALVVHLVLRPPSGAPANALDLHYDVITRELVTHAALVSVRSDWKSGVAPDSPELVGAIGGHMTHLMVDRTGGTAWRGFRSIFMLGMNHIAEGTDHLLFLLTLLLPAPLCAVCGRWRRAGRPAHSVLQIAKIVSAFTVGHSVTLLLGTVGLVHVPEPPIEVLIAASILVSAAHAMRPIFPGREYVVAAGFGLVHGLSFAVVLSELDLDRWGMTVGILGFNLGIETMQLLVVLATMPWLLLLSTTPAYPAFRIAGAGIAAVAAAGWTAERAVGWDNPVGPIVDGLAVHAAWILAALAAASLVAKAVQVGSRLARAPLPRPVRKPSLARSGEASDPEGRVATS